MLEPLRLSPLVAALMLTVLPACARNGSASGAALAHPKAEDPVAIHEVAFDVAAPRDAFVAAFLRAPLERFIKGTKALPGVERTEPLTVARFPAVGSVRRVVLRDGHTAREEVLACDEAQLRYFVTQYTSPEAKPIEWGLGEFTFSAAGSRTHVTWRYSFKLRSNRFPGELGAIGRLLFRKAFLERDYAAFMDAQVREIQDFARHEVRGS